MLHHVALVGLALLLGASPESEDAAAVRRLMQDREAAWKKWDFDTLAQQLAEDAERWDARGEITEGRKAIDQHYRAVFQTEESRQIRFHHRVDKIRLVTPDVALVDASWHTESLAGKQTTDDKQPGASPAGRAGKSLFVLRKRTGGDWEIVTLRTSFSVAESSPKQAE